MTALIAIPASLQWGDIGVIALMFAPWVLLLGAMEKRRLDHRRSDRSGLPRS